MNQSGKALAMLEGMMGPQIWLGHGVWQRWGFHWVDL